MRLTPNDAREGLFADMHLVHMACVFYRMRCLAHRPIEFGFERFVNDLTPRELVVLAVFMPPHQHDTLVAEAHRCGDAALQAWIVARCPEIVQEAA